MTTARALICRTVHDDPDRRWVAHIADAFATNTGRIAQRRDNGDGHREYAPTWEAALAAAHAHLAPEPRIEAACGYCHHPGAEPCEEPSSGPELCTRAEGHEPPHVACSDHQHGAVMWASTVETILDPLPAAERFRASLLNACPGTGPLAHRLEQALRYRPDVAYHASIDQDGRTWVSAPNRSAHRGGLAFDPAYFAEHPSAGTLGEYPDSPDEPEEESPTDYAARRYAETDGWKRQDDYPTGGLVDDTALGEEYRRGLAAFMDTDSAFAAFNAEQRARAERERLGRIVQDVADGDGHTAQVYGVKIAKCDTYGHTEEERGLRTAREEALGRAQELERQLQQEKHRAEHQQLTHLEMTEELASQLETAEQERDGAARQLAHRTRERDSALEDREKLQERLAIAEKHRQEANSNIRSLAASRAAATREAATQRKRAIDAEEKAQQLRKTMLDNAASLEQILDGLDGAGFMTDPVLLSRHLAECGATVGPPSNALTILDDLRTLPDTMEPATDLGRARLLHALGYRKP